MPPFLLLFEVVSGQLGVLVWPQPSSVLGHLMYQNSPRSWTRGCSWHHCAWGTVRAAVELGLAAAEGCGAGNEPRLG